jgi:hypothetical protein
MAHCRVHMVMLGLLFVPQLPKESSAPWSVTYNAKIRMEITCCNLKPHYDCPQYISLYKEYLRSCFAGAHRPPLNFVPFSVIVLRAKRPVLICSKRRHNKQQALCSEETSYILLSAATDMRVCSCCHLYIVLCVIVPGNPSLSLS